MILFMGFDRSWEENVYSHRKAVNQYPYSDVVSQTMRLFAKRLQAGETLSALDVGCGTGNHTAFLALSGFNAFGIEGSASGVEIARKFIEDRKLSADIRVGDFVKLPYDANSFDFVVDRQSITCNSIGDIRKITAEIHRVLKPEGYFLSFINSIQHGSYKHKLGREIEERTLTDFSSGPFVGVGKIHFFTRDEVEKVLMENFKVKFLYHHQMDLLCSQEANEFAEFIACGQK